MADSKELKPKSFRIDDETAEKFKEIASSLGGSQQETLAKLIESFEFQQGKAVLTEKKTDIEQFEKYVSCLTRMYMSTLEDNQNITETVRTEFDALLKSKDSIIQDLQEKLTMAKQLKDEATTKARTYSSENEMIKQAMERLTSEYESKLDNMQDILNEKEESNQLLKSAYTDLKAKNENIKADAEHTQELRRELDGLTSEYNKLQTAYKELEAELKQEKVVAELKLEKTLLENERKYQEQIQKLKEEKQIEIDKYQQKYLALLEQFEQPKTKRTSKTTKTESKSNS